jgi:hypothetical protein
MDLQGIREALHRQPFEPFSIRLADGRSLAVPHPEMVAVGKRRVIVVEPDEAKRNADKLEIHPTPKHGSWLNMAEIEISVMARQCLAERMDNIEHLEGEVMAWVEKRNAQEVKVDWRFTTADARIRLKKLYPALHE